METYPLKASVRHHLGVAIVDLRGEIDGGAEEVMDKAYARAEEHDPATILLNFSRVTYINSKGIALIVLLLARSQKSDRRLLACGLTDHFREIFQITRLSDYIGVCRDEETAIDKILALDATLQARPGQRQVQAN